ncbi:MAG: hypothetical protein RIQ89_118 [Bacteroidota bacterium]|jgi:deoxyribodipyrimidine photo-lyase
MGPKINICWLRRDLRLDDQAALYHALKSGLPVLCVFIFDKEILDKLSDKADKRVAFIHYQLNKLNDRLATFQSSLLVMHDTPAQAWQQLINRFQVNAVFTNHDYEPYAISRDAKIGLLLQQQGIAFYTFKDQSIFEKNEVTKDDGKPYTVFTPFKNKWRSKISPFYLKSYPNKKYFNNFLKAKAFAMPTLPELGFNSSSLTFYEPALSKNLLENYASQRDIPSVKGTSRLSVHLRFGTVSIRELCSYAWSVSDAWVNELIWRDFYMAILYHFPHVNHQAFKKDYNNIPWMNDEAIFTKWCNGLTGYPIVDAGMRELNATGFMHNRVRMITASFLCKHLLIDWRWGEAYFAQKLLDFDLSANNGGWQWSASTGCDAAPYFRFFNPAEQTKKFDPAMIYIKKWIPELLTDSYPKPIVDHKFARERCLKHYKTHLAKN